jgi:cytidylate kinase
LVTIDGPAGSGKSTLGRRLALALALPFIDTGLFYRGVTVAVIRGGVDVDDEAAVAALAARSRLVINTDPALPAGNGEVLIDGADAGPLLRDPSHAELLSRVSSIPGVRSALLEPQRALGEHGAVAVGRDCGTVVFPHAQLKIFLQAGDAVRRARRARQLAATAAATGAAEGGTLHAEISGRDRIDSARAASPLRRPTDAHIIDTEALDVEQMVQRALELCAEAGWAAQ